MTTRRQAAVSGFHWVEAPAISREAASDILGAEIPIGTWEAIEAAFKRFGAGMADLETSRPNNAKNDPQSWNQQQKSVLADLGRALDCIDRVTHVDHLKLSRKPRPFLDDAANNYSLQHAGRSGLMNVRRDLDTMKKRLVEIVVIIGRAEPFEVDVPTEPTLRRDLIVAIDSALQQAGLPVTHSSNDSRGQLTRFETLLIKLGISRGASDEAFAKKVKRAKTKVGPRSPQ